MDFLTFNLTHSSPSAPMHVLFSFQPSLVLAGPFSSPFTLVHLFARFIFIFPSLPQNSCAPSLPPSVCLSLSLSDYRCLFICLLFPPQKPPGQSSVCLSLCTFFFFFLPLFLNLSQLFFFFLSRLSDPQRSIKERGRAYSKSCFPPQEKKKKGKAGGFFLKKKVSSFWY